MAKDPENLSYSDMDGIIPIPSLIEPLPEPTSAKLAKYMEEATARLQADFWKMFGNECVIPSKPICGCSIVHTCNTVV